MDAGISEEVKAADPAGQDFREAHDFAFPGGHRDELLPLLLPDPDDIRLRFRRYLVAVTLHLARLVELDAGQPLAHRLNRALAVRLEAAGVGADPETSGRRRLRSAFDVDLLQLRNLKGPRLPL